MLTNNKNGNVILVKFIVISNFSPFSIKPGAINNTKIGIKISIIRTINKRPKIKKLNTLLANLFEFPVFFYIACVVIYITGKVDDYFILLAFWFVGFRVIHSVYHIFLNNFISVLPLRAIFFVPSWIILVWIWVRLITSF